MPPRGWRKANRQEGTMAGQTMEERDEEARRKAAEESAIAARQKELDRRAAIKEAQVAAEAAESRSVARSA